MRAGRTAFDLHFRKEAPVPMRIVFMGTPEFAVPSLTALFEAGHEIVAVFTQPDKPVGRKQILTPPAGQGGGAAPTGCPSISPRPSKTGPASPCSGSLRHELDRGGGIRENPAPAMCSTLPVHGLHQPARFAAAQIPGRRSHPVVQCINGDAQSGVTTMYLASGVDTGDMICSSAATPIGEYETYGELHDRLAVLGAPLLVETVRRIEQGSAPRTPQDEAQASYAPMLDKTISRLDFSKPARQLSKLICGTNPWPVANTLYEGKLLKVYAALVGGPSTAAPGFAVQHADGICVACGDETSLLLTEVQLEGGKRMGAAQFLAGHPMKEPVLLGEG